MAKQTFTTGQVPTAAQMTSLQQTAMLGGAATAKTASYTLVAADAGTAISMSNASATTITVNTGLFAAGDTVFIQNLGAGACTVTAGTATVNTAGSLILPQYDAGILYFVSTSSAIFYDYIQVGAASPLTTKGDIYGFSTSDARIPIGTNNQVLTADSTQPLGLKWATPAGGGGKVLQVVQGSSTTSTNITSTTFTDTNLSASITPSSSTSKVLVMFSQVTSTVRNAIEIGSGTRLLRDSTAIYSPGGAGFETAYFYSTAIGTGANNIKSVVSGMYLDSPATTSATTYKTQARTQNSTSSPSVQLNDGISTMILMEIGA